jgi:hypothetical protein
MARKLPTIFRVTLINAIVLVALGLWGYLAKSEPTTDATLIPMAFGLVFGIALPLYQEENRLISYLFLVLTLLLTIALWIPMVRAYQAEQTSELIRLSLMVLSCCLALFYYLVAFLRHRT